MSRWIAICQTAECGPGSAGEFVAEDRIVALFNVAGVYYALDGVCPHQGGPLGKGRLTGCILTCPWHGWQFDVRDGQHQLSQAYRHPTFPVKIDGDQVLIDLDGPAGNA